MTSITTVGGTRSSPRIAWPSGPANQARNACAAAWFAEAFTTTPPYVAGTLAASGTATVVTFVDVFASVTYTTPASPSPSSILETTAATLSSFDAMFALYFATKSAG